MQRSFVYSVWPMSPTATTLWKSSTVVSSGRQASTSISTSMSPKEGILSRNTDVLSAVFRIQPGTKEICHSHSHVLVRTVLLSGTPLGITLGFLKQGSKPPHPQIPQPLRALETPAVQVSPPLPALVVSSRESAYANAGTTQHVAMASIGTGNVFITKLQIMRRSAPIMPNP